MPSFFWFDLFLETGCPWARAEILKKIYLSFGRFEDTKKTFPNYCSISMQYSNTYTAILVVHTAYKPTNDAFFALVTYALRLLNIIWFTGYRFSRIVSAGTILFDFESVNLLIVENSNSCHKFQFFLQKLFKGGNCMRK